MVTMVTMVTMVMMMFIKHQHRNFLIFNTEVLIAFILFIVVIVKEKLMIKSPDTEVLMS